MSSASHPVNPAINATVMASAGTGKTWLLVTRLVHLLLSGAQPDSILAITFTRKAAAEMQSRLSERLYELASVDDTQLTRTLKEMGIRDDAHTREQVRTLYEQLLHAPQPVRATTFHAFCQSILRRFPLEADIPPGFELSEQTHELLDASMEALSLEATQHPNGAIAQDLEILLDCCGGLDNLRKALNSFINHRSDWWAYTENQTDATAFAEQALSEQLQVTTRDAPLAEFFTDRLQAEMVEFRELLARHPNKTNDGFRARFEFILDETLSHERRIAEIREVFLTRDGKARTRKASPTLLKKLGEAGQARFVELHELYCARLERLQDRIAALESLRASGAWYRLGQQLLDHYQRIKNELRILDFADLEWKAYQLLNKEDYADWVQYKLDQRIDHLLVDEFQDTNPTQWRLLLPLLKEMAAGETERQRSVFLVGDAKQSIYRFRRAEPRLFDAAQDWLNQHLDSHTFTQHHSWRSAPAIMEAANRVFDNGGPMHHWMPHYETHDTHHRELWGRVELLPLIAEDETEAIEPITFRNPLHQPRPETGEDRHYREACLIADTIQSLISNHTLMGAADQARPLRYSDIYLLFRNRSHIKSFERALREAQIPYIGADRGTLLDSLEVRDMVALLNTLLTPFNNLALAEVLRSPLFACSDDDLITLAKVAGRSIWFEHLLKVGPEQSEGSPLHRAAYWLARWREQVGQVPIHDLLDRIYSEGNVIARYESAVPDHLCSRVRANLTRFIELALEIDQGRYPSLTHFLAQLADLRERGNEAPDEAPAAGEGDRVRLLTMHAAKGLEAPVVFLADCAGPSRDERPYYALVDWPSEAERPRHFFLVGRKDQHCASIREKIQAETQALEREAANLLYVAMTRARQCLYISGSKPGRGNELGWYGLLSKALQGDEQQGPCVIENGLPPQADTSSEEARSVAEIVIPPTLTQPIQEKRRIREIAPSHQVKEHSLGAGDEDGRLRGLVIHRLLELMSQDSVPDPQAIGRRVANEFKLSPTDEEFQQWLDEAHCTRHAPALAYLFDAEHYDEAYNEVSLHYLSGEHTVFGVIDRLVVAGNSVYVIDYKSHRQALAEDPNPIADHYREQMRLYMEGVKRLWPNHRVAGRILFTAIADEVAVTLEADA